MPALPIGRRFRHVYLLVCLLAVVVVRPFLEASTLASGALTVIQLACLVAAAFVAIDSPRTGRWVGALLLLALGFGVAVEVQDSPTHLVVTGFLLSSIAFYLFVAGLLLRALSRPSVRVTEDTICGTINVYLIVGVAWAFAYALLEAQAPGSFAFPGGAPGDAAKLDAARFDRFLGFSFITQTTLGYGNVSPVTPRADALTVLQAITGQFYIAVVVARFVALQLVQAQPPPGDAS